MGARDGTTVEIINVIDDCTRVLIASWRCRHAHHELLGCLVPGGATVGMARRVLSDNGIAFRGPTGHGGFLPALAALGIEDRHSRRITRRPAAKSNVSTTPSNCISPPATRRRHSSSCKPSSTGSPSVTTITGHTARSVAGSLPMWAATPRSGPASSPLGTPTTTSTTAVGTDGRISIASRTRIGLGVAHAGQIAITVTTGGNAHVFIDGRLVRQLTINPNTHETNPKECE